MIIAHLSDLHLRRKHRGLAFGRINTTAMAKRAFEKVARLGSQPDLLVITGDLADTGDIEEYVLLREMISGLPMPVRACNPICEMRD